MRTRILQILTITVTLCLMAASIFVYGLYNSTETFAEPVYTEPTLTQPIRPTSGSYYDENGSIQFYAVKDYYDSTEAYAAIQNDTSRYDSDAGKAWYTSRGWETKTDNLSSDVMTYKTSVSGNDKVLVRRITPSQTADGIVGRLVSFLGCEEIWNYGYSFTIKYFPWYNCFQPESAENLLNLGWINYETVWTLSEPIYTKKDGVYTATGEYVYATYDILSATQGSVDLIALFNGEDIYGFGLSQIAAEYGLNKDDAAKIGVSINEAINILREQLGKDSYPPYYVCEHEKQQVFAPFSGNEASNNSLIQMYKNHGIGNAIDYKTWSSIGECGHDQKVVVNNVSNQDTEGVYYKCWCGSLHLVQRISYLDKLLKEFDGHELSESVKKGQNILYDYKVCWCGEVHIIDRRKVSWWERNFKISWLEVAYRPCQNRWQTFDIPTWDCGWKTQGSISYKLDLVGHGDMIRIQLKQN